MSALRHKLDAAPLKPRDEGGDVAKTTTGAGREEVRQLRMSCPNTVSFAAQMLSNRWLYHANVIILGILKPVAE
eukprot:624080-Pyramimonas_sp.AAC.1